MRAPILLALALPLMAQAPALSQAEAILARVDRLRHPWPAFTVELTMVSGRSSQRWRVMARENGDVRLDGLSEAEKGRAVLQKGDDLWLLLPGTKHPIRVTPQQRLLGPTAAGDVARTRFREDYRVTAQEEVSFEGRACWRLNLAARRPALSARTVQLWVDRATGTPLQAEFHLASGKLARTARFAPPVEAEGRAVLSRMEVVEADGSTATLVFSHWHPGGVDPGKFLLPGS
ncbi:MAG: outer membrane lipoprotein-sorting protein [Acidobacteriota bacterium]|nr:outer membrane lipoprotein-sorting protein [Acidobacteriota bacterium]